MGDLLGIPRVQHALFEDLTQMAALAELARGDGNRDTQRILISFMQEVGDLFEPEDLDTAVSHHVRSIGAPVFGPDGAVELALKLYDFPDALTYQQVMTYQARLVEAARDALDLVVGAMGRPQS